MADRMGTPYLQKVLNQVKPKAFVVKGSFCNDGTNKNSLLRLVLVSEPYLFFPAFNLVNLHNIINKAACYTGTWKLNVRCNFCLLLAVLHSPCSPEYEH